MKQKTLTKMIIIIAIAVIILIGLIYIIKNNDSEITTNEEELGEEIETEEQIEETSAINTENYVEFYTMSDCVNIYMDYLNVKNSSYYEYDDGNYTMIVSDEEINQNIYSLLSEEYIEANEITLDNLRDKVTTFEEKIKFTPLKMKEYTLGSVEKYLMYGILTDTDINLVDEIYIFVNWDVSNNTFSIEPIDQEYSDIDEIEIVNKNKTIEENDLNSVESAVVSYEYLCEQRFLTYKRLILAMPELAYEYLDEEYCSLRFGSYENFTEYITDNYDNLTMATLLKYGVEEEDNGNMVYTCEDSYGNVYTFKETDEIMDITVQLDDYTILSDDYIEAYNSATDEEKVQTDIEMFFKMINTKDYSGAYDLLNDRFKSSNFASLDDFKTYAKENFFDNTTITEVSDISKSGTYYVCTFTAASGSSSASTDETSEETFIVSLGDETDFELSFTVK